MGRWVGAIALSALAVGVAGGCASPFESWAQPSTPEQPMAAALTGAPFTRDATRDHDGDCLDDEAEHAIAQWFTPWFRFDSRENARREGEPVLLYQVTSPDACAGGGAIELRYAYLFADDGGYVGAPHCGNAHHGDNQYLRAALRYESDPPRAVLEYLIASGFYWPRHAMHFEEGHHALVLLSAGKHHPFVDTVVDGRASPYSSWGCAEAMDGAGALVQTTVDVDARLAPLGRTNVGERAIHPREYFVGALDTLGYPGEHAWGDAPFCGARPREGCTDDVSPMQIVWR